MKKKSLKLMPSLLICLLCLSSSLSSCAYKSTDFSDSPNETSQQSTTNLTDARIKELEAQIISLLQSQQISESERKQEISILKAELDALKKKDFESSSDTTTESDSPKIFNYTLNGYRLTINSINTDEESISIPSVIDGHAVIAIGSEALSSKSVTRIVLENGIESLDWFAFKGCTSLSTISIPESVTSIGYGAFDGASKSLTIECKKDSFAMKYAQSYGIKYTLIS